LLTTEEEIVDLMKGVKVELLQECVLPRVAQMLKGWLHIPLTTKRRLDPARLQE
jgi:antibiotic biosynthesis monooxygenase (ABM) superfamily enzyme